MASIIDNIAEKLKLKRVTEQSIISIPGTTAELETVFKNFLDKENIEPLSKINDLRRIGYCNLLRAASINRKKDDLKGFCKDLYEGFLTLSVTEQGYRSMQLTTVASGFMAAMKDMQKIESSMGGGKSDLEKRGLI